MSPDWNRQYRVAVAFSSAATAGDLKQGNVQSPNSVTTSTDVETLLKHVLLWHGGRALECRRFRYWGISTILRNKNALASRKGFWNQNPGDRELDIATLRGAEKRDLLNIECIATEIFCSADLGNPSSFAMWQAKRQN